MNVAVIAKSSKRGILRDRRPSGWWSYPVPEVEWNFFTLGSGFKASRRRFERRGYDVIFHEDAGNWGQWYHDSTIPLIYYSIDATLSSTHFEERYEQGRQADLILVDHDSPARYERTGKRTRFMPHAVNDRVFYPGTEKLWDVVFLCGRTRQGSAERHAVDHFLVEFCRERRYTLLDGGLDLGSYAEALRRAKIVVNVPRVLGNRSHRLLDGLGSESCVLTREVPVLPSDYLLPREHYELFGTLEDLGQKIDELLSSGRWLQLARRGYNVIRERHLWSVRARQFKAVVQDVK